MDAEGSGLSRLGPVRDIADSEVVHGIATNTLIHHAVWVTVVLACSIVDIAKLLLDRSDILVMPVERNWEAGCQQAIRVGRLT